MATQLQLAYPETFPRAGVLAGGPYDCITVTGGMKNCLYPAALSSQQLRAMVDRAVQNADNHLLGDLTHLNHGVLYALYGTEDQVVGTQIAGSVATFYRQLKTTLGSQLTDLQISEDGTHDFGHTFLRIYRLCQSPIRASGIIAINPYPRTLGVAGSMGLRASSPTCIPTSRRERSLTMLAANSPSFR